VDPSRPPLPGDDPSLSWATARPGEPAARVLGGRYQLLRRLGRGGMGEVHLAFDPVLNRQVAVKLCLAAFDDDTSADFLRFRAEAQVAAALSNAYIVVVYDWGLDGGRPFLVTEYLAGGSWQDAIRARRPQPWREATQAVWQAAQGLAAIHGRELTHRDVKPANLLRSADGNTTKIADFGLVHSRAAIVSLTSAGVIAGTPLYIAPELLKGVKDDPRADVYSLTATYYALLTGHAPFEECHPDVQHLFHLERPFPDPEEYGVKDIPAGVMAVIRRGSEKDPSRRYATADELAQGLSELLVPPRLKGQGLILGRRVSREEQERHAEIEAWLLAWEDDDKKGSAGKDVAGARFRWSKEWAELADHECCTCLNLLGLPQTIHVCGCGACYCEACFESTVRSSAQGALCNARPSRKHSRTTSEFRIVVSHVPGRRLLPKYPLSEEWLSLADSACPCCRAPVGRPKVAYVCHCGACYCEMCFEALIRHGTQDPLCRASWSNNHSRRVNDFREVVSCLAGGGRTGHRSGTTKALPPVVRTPVLLRSSEEARRQQQEWAGALGVAEAWTNALGVAFRLIPPGRITLGAPPGDLEAEKHEGPAREWVFAEAAAFWVAVFPLTRGLLRDFLRDTSPEHSRLRNDVSFRNRHGSSTGGDDRPAVNLDFAEAQELCRWLGGDGNAYRLPTEAEWEYFARAGAGGRFWWEAAVPAGEPSDRQAPEAARLAHFAAAAPVPADPARANAWGVVDVLGNVAEWTCSPSTLTLTEAAGRPAPPGEKSVVVRGGCFSDRELKGLRLTRRHSMRVTTRPDWVGVRVVCELSPAHRR
jgi:formylglycine-generating enzyme required for sulfatase activity